MIKADKICKSYGDKIVFKDINFSIPYGGSRCVMGPSGCGKTTLLHILMGLIKPDSGSISGLEGLKPSPVFQEDRLCENLSVGANLRLICGREKEKQIAETLSAFELADCLKKPVQELSGGMKRRIAIARALLDEGNLFLFDEPFKGLDDAMKYRIAEYIKANISGKTLIWVSHDIEEAELMESEILRLS